MPYCTKRAARNAPNATAHHANIAVPSHVRILAYHAFLHSQEGRCVRI